MWKEYQKLQKISMYMARVELQIMVIYIIYHLL